MKKIISTIIIVGIAIIFAITCPNSEDHRHALAVTFSRALDTELQEKSSGDGALYKGIAFLGSMFATKMINEILDKQLTVHNYVFFSLGELDLGQESRYVSFGILNNVITCSEEEVRNGMSPEGN